MEANFYVPKLTTGMTTAVIIAGSDGIRVKEAAGAGASTSASAGVSKADVDARYNWVDEVARK